MQVGQENLVFDTFIIGGGVNGAGIARDAAGRGLSVGLCERADFANATSSASSKLIHGGLRYLEHYKFKLVAQALAERERLLAIAPHITWPMRFVLPYEPHLRPAWMLRAGLFLYDHLHHAYGVKRTLPSSCSVRLNPQNSQNPPHMEPRLQPHLTKGFEYSDVWVDDARLTILNVMDAHQRGAAIYARTECIHAVHDGVLWHLTLRRSAASDGIAEHNESDRIVNIRSRTVVNAAGPWVQDVAQHNQLPSQGQVQWIKGSHVIVPRLHTGQQAYILQQPDSRIVFVMPYEQHFTLIGTTDVRVSKEDLGYTLQASEAEIDYLLTAANRSFAKTWLGDDVIHTYAGVRPLYDDGSANPSQTTRDYTLKTQQGWLDVYGGKITTYRALAQTAIDMLRPHLKAAGVSIGSDWSERATLPGGDIGAFEPFFKDLHQQHPQFNTLWLKSAAHRHGSNIHRWLSKDLGDDLGGGLMQAEAQYLKDHEWAMTLDDMLWRRTKCGLHAKAGPMSQGFGTHSVPPI